MERQMTIEALGLGDGAVRIQITSVDAGMNVDLDRQAAMNFAVGILRQAGVSSVSIERDGSYRAEGKR